MVQGVRVRSTAQGGDETCGPSTDVLVVDPIEGVLHHTRHRPVIFRRTDQESITVNHGATKFDDVRILPGVRCPNQRQWVRSMVPEGHVRSEAPSKLSCQTEHATCGRVRIDRARYHQQSHSSGHDVAWGPTEMNARSWASKPYSRSLTQSNCDGRWPIHGCASKGWFDLDVQRCERSHR